MNNFLQILIYLAGFAIISVASNHLSKLFLKVKLPLITGFLVMGIIAGPDVLELIPRGAIAELDFVNDIALAFIALNVGAELYLRELRSRFRSITGMTVGLMSISFILGSLVVFFLAEYIPFMQRMNFESRIAVSLLAGTIFTSLSPASTIAVVHERRAKGPFTRTTLGVTVLTDFLVIVLFSLIITIGEALIKSQSFTLVHLVLLLVDLMLAFVLGYALSKILVFIMSMKMKATAKIILVLPAGYGIFALSDFVREWSLLHMNVEILIEPLLSCIIASFILTNYSKHRPEFLKLLHEYRSAVYVVFFTLVGASVSLDILLTIWEIALGLFIIRVLILIAGGYVGGSLGGDPPRFKRIAWMPYVTQAGVSLALVTLVAGEFTAWGREFTTILVAVIVISQIVGPPLFAWALEMVNEGHVRAIHKKVIKQCALIFGLESQSIALARQLQGNNWDVRIATLRPDISEMTASGIAVSQIKDLSVESMERIEAFKATTIVAMLSDEENYRICEQAYERLGTKNIIVRLHNRKNFDRFHALGALIVEPSTAIVSLLDHFVRSPQAVSLLLGMEENQDTLMLQVQNPDLHGMALRNVRLPHDITVLSISRGGQMILSHGYTRLRMNDIVTLVGSKKSLEHVRLRFEK